MKISILLLLVLAFSSCSSLKIMKKENTSFLALSASTSYLGGTGKGMNVTLKNLETGEKYESNKLSHFSSICIVQNIKPGIYIVEKIVLNTGGHEFSNWAKNIQNYFGIIDIGINQKYYLGTFRGRIKVKLKNAISIQLMNHDVPNKLQTFLKENHTGWENGEFNKIKTISKEELIIF